MKIGRLKDFSHWFYKKIVPCWMAFSLFLSVSGIVRAEVDQNMDSQTQHTQGTSAQVAHNFKISEQLGYVLSRFRGSSNRLVIHIQDAHCNFEAQSNIARILRKLFRKYGRLGLKTVFVEGSSGPLNTAAFTAFPNHQIRNELALYFLRKGKISGAEYFSIIKELPIDIKGIEDFSLYLENVRWFDRSLKLRKHADAVIKNLEKVLQELAEKIFNPKLKAFLKMNQDYQEGKLSLSEFLFNLQAFSNEYKMKIRGLNDVISFLKSENMNIQVMEQELRTLLKKLLLSLTKEEVKRLLSLHLKFKVGKVSMEHYFRTLENLLNTKKIEIKSFSNFSRHMHYLRYFQRMKRSGFLKRLEIWTQQIKKPLFKNQEEQDLDRFINDLKFLKKFYHLELSREDLKFYHESKQGKRISRFKEFLTGICQKYGVILPDLEKIGFLERNLSELEGFYDAALRRDKVLVEQMLKGLDSNGGKIAVLITGGFHTEGITQRLKAKGISYVVIAPRINHLDAESPYLSIMQDKRTPTEEIFDQEFSTLNLAQGQVSSLNLVQPTSPLQPVEVLENLLQDASLNDGDRKIISRKLKTIYLFHRFYPFLFKLLSSMVGQTSWDQVWDEWKMRRQLLGVDPWIEKIILNADENVHIEGLDESENYCFFHLNVHKNPCQIILNKRLSSLSDEALRQPSFEIRLLKHISREFEGLKSWLGIRLKTAVRFLSAMFSPFRFVMKLKEAFAVFFIMTVFNWSTPKIANAQQGSDTEIGYVVRTAASYCLNLTPQANVSEYHIYTSDHQEALEALRSYLITGEERYRTRARELGYQEYSSSSASAIDLEHSYGHDYLMVRTTRGTGGSTTPDSPSQVVLIGSRALPDSDFYLRYSYGGSFTFRSQERAEEMLWEGSTREATVGFFLPEILAPWGRPLLLEGSYRSQPFTHAGQRYLSVWGDIHLGTRFHYNNPESTFNFRLDPRIGALFTPVQTFGFSSRLGYELQGIARLGESDSFEFHLPGEGRLIYMPNVPFDFNTWDETGTVPNRITPYISLRRANLYSRLLFEPAILYVHRFNSDFSIGLGPKFESEITNPLTNTLLGTARFTLPTNFEFTFEAGNSWSNRFVSGHSPVIGFDLDWNPHPVFGLTAEFEDELAEPHITGSLTTRFRLPNQWELFMTLADVWRAGQGPLEYRFLGGIQTPMSYPGYRERAPLHTGKETGQEQIKDFGKIDEGQFIFDEKSQTAFGFDMLKRNEYSRKINEALKFLDQFIDLKGADLLVAFVEDLDTWMDFGHDKNLLRIDTDAIRDDYYSKEILALLLNHEMAHARGADEVGAILTDLALFKRLKSMNPDFKFPDVLKERHGYFEFLEKNYSLTKEKKVLAIYEFLLEGDFVHDGALDLRSTRNNQLRFAQEIEAKMKLRQIFLDFPSSAARSNLDNLKNRELFNSMA